MPSQAEPNVNDDPEDDNQEAATGGLNDPTPTPHEDTSGGDPDDVIIDQALEIADKTFAVC